LWQFFINDDRKDTIQRHTYQRWLDQFSSNLEDISSWQNFHRINVLLLFSHYWRTNAWNLVSENSHFNVCHIFSKQCLKIVTGFGKTRLHAYPIPQLQSAVAYHHIMLLTWTFHTSLSYVHKTAGKNWKLIAYFRLKLWIFKPAKIYVCGSLVLWNPVAIIYPLESLIKAVNDHPKYKFVLYHNL